MAIAIYLCDAIFFVVFGSGDEQYWNTICVANASSSDLSIPQKKEPTTKSSSTYPGINTDSENERPQDYRNSMIPRAKLDSHGT